MEILKLVYFALQSFAQGVVSLITDPMLLILIIFLSMSQYRNMMSIQKQMYGGRVKTKLRDMVTTSFLAGLLAGLGGSILITVLGITFFKMNGLLAVIIFSLLLMFFINPRYVCLSYSGGILSLISLILTALIANGILDKGNSYVQFLNNGLDIDVSGLMIIIAIMHFIEAILMWIDGHRGAVPVFMKHRGKMVGGFVMQRIWIIPILFYILAQSSEVVGQTVATPNWWPLFGPNLSRAELSKAIFAALPLLVMLGYSDFSISTPVVMKVRRASLGLVGYSLILLVLALVSYKVYAFKYIAAIFAPIAHEMLILFERYKESTGTPLWSCADDGVVVVDTIPLSTAERIGLKSGDKLVGINNTPVRNIEDIIEIMGEYLNYIWIDVINIKGEKRMIEFANYQGRVKELGIITVPKDDKNVLYVEDRNGSMFKRMRDRFKK